MKQLYSVFRIVGVTFILATLTGCDDPQVYGSIGVSSGYSNYGHGYGHGYGRGYGGWGSGMHTSISVGGRIR
ncbi:MAG: hypothetical protein ABJ084_12825 [Halioglobus sp.]